MNNKKQLLSIGLAFQSIVCGILSVIFWNKRKTMAAIFAGAGLAGGIASVIVYLKGGCVCNENDECCCDECTAPDTFEDESDVSDEEIFCDFENSPAEEPEITE